ncbi:hypothetical protein UY3_01248 [Chelonia mydas]|uniref:Uncharacterized protein n=1 Tax=Chelonia mydas TaxID=8469 RepID=M7CA60_CHEMY|nr:hypothetical protein UY3_01248 [Chelonia mydas]
MWAAPLARRCLPEPSDGEPEQEELTTELSGRISNRKLFCLRPRQRASRCLQEDVIVSTCEHPTLLGHDLRTGHLQQPFLSQTFYTALPTPPHLPWNGPLLTQAWASAVNATVGLGGHCQANLPAALAATPTLLQGENEECERNTLNLHRILKGEADNRRIIQLLRQSRSS